MVTGIVGGIVGRMGSAKRAHEARGSQPGYTVGSWTATGAPPLMNEWQRAERHADRALDLFDRGFLEEAESELRKALEIQPEQADWQFNLGLTLEAAQRDQEAMEQFERAAALAPDQVHPNLAVGAMAIRLNQWPKALAAFEMILSIESSCEEAHAGRIESLCGAGEHDEAEAAFYLAEMAMEDSSAMCLQAIATSLITRRSYPRAEWCLRKAIRLAPDIPEAPVQLAMLLAETSRSNDALRIFSDLLRERPDDVPTLLASAKLFVKLGRLPEAMGRLDRLLRIEPIHLETRKLLELALQQWDRFLELSSSIAIGETDHLANLLLAAGMNAEAATVLDASMERETPTVDRWRSLAMARFRSGDMEGGSRASRAVLRTDAACLRSMHNLVLASLMQGRLVHAASWLRRGLASHPRDEGLRRLRIRCWAQRILRHIGIGRSTRAGSGH